MGATEWIALTMLMATIIFSSIGLGIRLSGNRNAILDRLNEHREALDDELTSMRQAGYQEYKELRREVEETSAKAYREFGESLAAIREKVNKIEVWILNELKDTRHTLTGAIDMRHRILEDKIEALDERIRTLEIALARSHPHPGSIPV